MIIGMWGVEMYEEKMRTDIRVPTDKEYLVFVMLKVIFYLSVNAVVFFNAVIDRQGFLERFYLISERNLFPFNIYPKILAVELVMLTFGMFVLMFYNDRFEGIKFAVKYKAIVLSLAFACLLVPIILLEAFYENPYFVNGLGYFFINLALNSLTILGFCFAPMILFSGTISIFMIKAPRNKEQDNTTGSANKVIYLSSYRLLRDR